MASTFKISNGDITINNSNGRPTLISDNKKLRQDLQEFFTIEVLPNGFGSGLDDLIGLIDISQDVYASMADRQIRDGLAAFIALQAKTNVERPRDERIQRVAYIAVEQNPTDPTKYYFRVNIITQSGAGLLLDTLNL